MTKQYVTVTKEAQQVAGITCDWCGCDLPFEPPNYGETRTELELTFSVAKCWPGNDGYGDGWSVGDLCETCGARLKELLQANGITVKEYGW